MNLWAFYLKLWNHYKPWMELFYILCWCAVGYFISLKYDLLEAYYDFSRNHESLELDEWAIVFHILAIALLIFAVRRWMENRKIRNELIRKNNELEKMLSEIKTLQGIIPICSCCKKIRNDKGYWTQVEEYLHEHTDAAFTHGICPECRDKSYAEYLRNKELKSRLMAE